MLIPGRQQFHDFVPRSALETVGAAKPLLEQSYSDIPLGNCLYQRFCCASRIGAPGQVPPFTEDSRDVWDVQSTHYRFSPNPAFCMIDLIGLPLNTQSLLQGSAKLGQH